MPHKKTNRRKNVNQPAPLPIQEDPLNKNVSNVEFRVIFTILAYSTATQNAMPVAFLAPSSPSVIVSKFKNDDWDRVSGYKSKVVLIVLVRILFAKIMVKTIRVFVIPIVMNVLRVASQSTELGILQRVVNKVSPIVTQFHQVARLSSVLLLVQPVVSIQTDYIPLSHGRIKKILLI